jgi:hypothetical protein
VKSRAEQYRQLAVDFHFMADLPPGENRSMLLKMAGWRTSKNKPVICGRKGQSAPAGVKAA